MSLVRVLSVALALMVVAWPARVLALDVPSLEGRVNDHAYLLPPERARALDERLAAYEKESGHQFVVLTIASLEGDPLEDFSIRTVEKWKLGHKKADDGLLLLVVKQERKVRIEVGYGLEGDIPDAVASRVIRQILVPAFRADDYPGGIERALAALMRAQKGQGLPVAPDPGHAPRPGWVFLLFLLLPFLAVIALFRRLGGSGGRFGGYGGYGGYGGWGGGSSGGSFGGGSFGGGGGGFSGGGGGFGGGGASGSW